MNKNDELPFEEIGLAALGNRPGMVIRQIDFALREAMKNIKDPNKDATKKRVVTLKISLAPNKDRTAAGIECFVETKFPGDKAVSDYVTISRDGRGTIAMTEQLDLTGPGLRAENGGE